MRPNLANFATIKPIPLRDSFFGGSIFQLPHRIAEPEVAEPLHSPSLLFAVRRCVLKEAWSFFLALQKTGLSLSALKPSLNGATPDPHLDKPALQAAYLRSSSSFKWKSKQGILFPYVVGEV